MQERLFVPFDVFGMRENVRVSSMVRVGDLGWTCGMCPLDRDSAVVAPDDLAAQSEFVCQMIKTVFGRAGFEPKDAAKLVVYHAAQTEQDHQAMVDQFEQHFPAQPVLVFVPVPHFYYAGMLLEVDAYADSTLRPVLQTFPAGIQMRQGQHLTYLAAKWTANTPVQGFLQAQGLSRGNLVSSQWYGSAEHVGNVKRLTKEFPIQDHEILIIERAASLFADFTVSQAGIVTKGSTQNPIQIRRSDPVVTLSCSVPQQDLTLVEQTKHIMKQLDRALADEGLSWSHVVKISAPYIGSASEADLHENLAIRHAYHPLPGPASTGLPVTAFADPANKIMVQLIAHL